MNDDRSEQIDECCNSSCQAPIHAGQNVYKAGEDVYCSFRCVAEDLKDSKPETFII
ncbi:hypothetical protein [Paenibacillus sp. GCM10027626]|uniref:hypothetical protein n=1 Tax=Paenibacillus sp. GCM10027626 TaxID=3273411 RepID=UPI00363BBA94